MSRYNFPIPVGWFQVARSSDIGPGAIKLVRYVGRDLILWRGEDGVARLQDAYCAHLGANIGVGGRVVGNRVQCPFHLWSYDGEGKVAEIPYASRLNESARLCTYPLVEFHGVVMAWYHPHHEPPHYPLPEVPELTNGEYLGPIVEKTHRIRTCLQEMAENTVDGAHFVSIHKHPGASHYDEVRFEGEKMVVGTTQEFPGSRGPVKGRLDVTSWGMGIAVMRYKTVIDIVMVATTAAVETDVSEQTFYVYYHNPQRDPRVDRIGAAFSKEVNRQVGEDIPIWENKIYRDKPHLAQGEAPITAFRKWVCQFYAESPAAA